LKGNLAEFFIVIIISFLTFIDLLELLQTKALFKQIPSSHRFIDIDIVILSYLPASFAETLHQSVFSCGLSPFP